MGSVGQLLVSYPTTLTENPGKPGNQILSTVRIHPTADISPEANIGAGTIIWHHCQVREAAVIGRDCILGKGVYVDQGVVIGDRVKIQNYVSLYHGVTVEEGVFIGPHVCFTNDMRPRAINPDGSLKAADDWKLVRTLVCKGASLGANNTIRCGVQIGAWAMVGAGSVVVADVPDYGLVSGNPARLRSFVCPCGSNLIEDRCEGALILARCPVCDRITEIEREIWEVCI